MRTFLAGVLFAALALSGLGVAAVEKGWLPAAADRKPGPIERWAAHHALRAAIARDSVGLVCPLQPTDANLLAGAHLYAVQCLVCHGAADGRPSAIARGLNVSPPQLAKDGVEDDPIPETYWKVKHGIRFTGMPSFGGALRDEQLWQLALFVGRLDRLPPAVASGWSALPSAVAP